MKLREDVAVVIVTHNLQQAYRVADYVGFMYLGELVEYGGAKGRIREALRGADQGVRERWVRLISAKRFRSPPSAPSRLRLPLAAARRPRTKTSGSVSAPSARSRAGRRSDRGQAAEPRCRGRAHRGAARRQGVRCGRDAPKHGSRGGQRPADRGRGEGLRRRAGPEQHRRDPLLPGPRPVARARRRDDLGLHERVRPRRRGRVRQVGKPTEVLAVAPGAHKLEVSHKKAGSPKKGPTTIKVEVKNPHDFPHYDLEVYAWAEKGDRIVAAGLKGARAHLEQRERGPHPDPGGGRRRVRDPGQCPCNFLRVR